MESLILLALAPIFYGCMLWEALYWRRRGVAQYTWRDTLSNMTLAGMHQVADGLAWVVLLGLYTVVYQFRLLDLDMGPWVVAALFIGQDFGHGWLLRDRKIQRLAQRSELSPMKPLLSISYSREGGDLATIGICRFTSIS